MSSRRIYECERCHKVFDEHKNLIKIRIGNRKTIEICKECLKDIDATLKEDGVI